MRRPKTFYELCERLSVALCVHHKFDGTDVGNCDPIDTKVLATAVNASEAELAIAFQTIFRDDDTDILGIMRHIHSRGEFSMEVVTELAETHGMSVVDMGCIAMLVFCDIDDPDLRRQLSVDTRTLD